MIILAAYTNVIKSFGMRLNSKNITEKLKTKDTETRKTKTQKGENLVSPKEYVENVDWYKPLPNETMTTCK